MGAWSSDSVPSKLLKVENTIGTPGCNRLPGEAIPQLPFARRRMRAARPALDDVAAG